MLSLMLIGPVMEQMERASRKSGLKGQGVRIGIDSVRCVKCI